ncbi:interleukin-2 receptor subunit alpha isoform X2 [Manis pentadactyla]|uniref:interleukin-2 receptor subunit alpha isoform X2 n=1 Tax=Manis pentadactyla TaxID=143292 RepID=UPI0018753AC3|nr:interleukin-2 receptor subunit alpha isoform X2 [Manis pentadactyla]
MEPSLLMWGVFTFITVPGCVAEFCDDNPPHLRFATFKALTYKEGTILNCHCKKGFRRISNRFPYMLCKGNSSHTFWENKCQCIRTSLGNREKQVIPEEKKENKTTEMQSQMQPMDQVNLPGHCGEPPPWEHEASERIYHFRVGQAVHYQCAQGFRAQQRRPAESICKLHCGETRWTWPQLKCINERGSQFPGEDKPQASTVAPPGSDTSCPLKTTGPTGTTNFQKYTEVATTIETFIFAVKYQIAVAGCVLLLISVLLLSGLTWQRRCFLYADVTLVAWSWAWWE